jgi:hypothetical protein
MVRLISAGASGGTENALSHCNIVLRYLVRANLPPIAWFYDIDAKVAAFDEFKACAGRPAWRNSICLLTVGILHDFPDAERTLNWGVVIAHEISRSASDARSAR